jgi:hypothetical protein
MVVTVGQLADALGAMGVRLCCAPRGRSVELHTLVVHDPNVPLEAASGHLVIGVGAGASQAVIELAEATAASALILHENTVPDEGLKLAAERSGVAILLVDARMPWAHLLGVISALLAASPDALAYRPGDLFALADAVATAVGGPTTIEDVQSRVLAYSGLQNDVDSARVQTILGRQVPPQVVRAFTERGVFEHLRKHSDPLYVPGADSNLRPRLVAAIRAGEELLGSIWAEVDCRPPREAHLALAAAAETAALHLLRARAGADVDRRIEADLVARSLHAETDPSQSLGRLGLPTRHLRVVALQIGGDDPAAASLVAFERATAGFGWGRPERSCLLGTVLFTVLPDDDAAAARRWVHRLIDDCSAVGPVLAGIGGPADAAELTASRAEAEECLAVLRSDVEAPTPLVYDEEWVRVLVYRLTQVASAGRRPAHSPVADLVAHDAQAGTAFTPTLRALLDAQGDVRAAACRLAIHPNTLRYRRRKMTELVELPLDEPRARLALQIELAVRAMGG